MMRVSVGFAVLATVGLASVALAQGAGSPPRITLAPVHGDKNNAVGSQLNGELCKVYVCVPYSKVSTNKKPDFKKAKKERVAGIFTTSITKTKKGYTAGVALLTTSSKPTQTWSFPLTSKRNMSSLAVKQVVHETGPVLGFSEDVAGVAAIAAAESAKAPAPVATTTPTSPMVSAPPPTSLSASETVTAIPPPPGAAPEKTLADTPVAVDATPPTNVGGVRGQPMFSVEVGGTFLNRQLSYTYPTGATENLLTYNANVIGMLMLGLEFYPFAKTGSFFTGLGIFANYQFAIGLQSQQPATGTQQTTNFGMGAAGLEARIRPVKYSDFAIVIPVAFRTYRFVVSNASSAFPGLANQNLLGVSAGLKLEIPIGSWFLILIGGDYVFWFQKNQLIGNTNPTFYNSGSAYALEGELGFGFYIIGPLSVRLYGEYSTTNYSLTADPTVPYTATAATDQLIGGRVVVRLDF
jgi:hypothetical protein